MLLWGLGVSLAWSDMRLESNLLDSFSKTNCSSSLRWQQVLFRIKKALGFHSMLPYPKVVKEGFSSVSVCFISFDSGAIWRLLQFAAAVSTFEVRQMICAEICISNGKTSCHFSPFIDERYLLTCLHSWLLL